MIVKESQNNWIEYQNKLIDLTQINYICLNWDYDISNFNIEFWFKDGKFVTFDFLISERDTAESIFRKVSIHLGTRFTTE